MDMSTSWLAGRTTCVSFSNGCSECCGRAPLVGSVVRSSKLTVSRLCLEYSRRAETILSSLLTPLRERKECVAPMKLATVFVSSSQQWTLGF